MACRAAVLASCRPYHHPMSRKDIIPTPSHPIKSWYMLFAVMITSIMIRNINRYLVNLLMFGSVPIYQAVNSVIDHVINRVIGVNRSEAVSMVIEMLMFSVGVVIRGSNDSVCSLFFISGVIGIRLTINNSIRLFLIFLGDCGIDRIRDRIMVRVIVAVIRFISTTWICTKVCGA